MSPPSHAVTGLVSYVLLTSTGLAIANPVTKATTVFRDEAHVWLWQPEHTETKAAEVALRLGLGVLRAARGRP